MQQPNAKLPLVPVAGAVVGLLALALGGGALFMRSARPPGLDADGPPSVSTSRPDSAGAELIRLSAGSGPTDLGACRQGTDFERAVEVVSVHDGPLAIASVETGCGCAVARFEGPNPLPAGGTGTVILRLLTGSYWGPHRQTVRILTPGRTAPAGSFDVLFDIRLGLVCEAGALRFETQIVGVDVTGRVSLVAEASAPPFEVLGVQSTDGIALAFDQVRVSRTDGRQAVDVTLRRPPEPRARAWQGGVTFTTSHPDRPSFVLPAEMQVVERFTALPASISFGFAGVGGERPVRRLRIVPGLPTLRTRVLGAQVQGKGYALRHLQAAAFGWEAELELDVARANRESPDGELVIRFEDETQPVLRVPLTVAFPKSS